MITTEIILAVALKNRTVLDHLGEALSSDLVTGNPFYRQIIVFADQFAMDYRKLPLMGDYEIWMGTLPDQQREGVKESLGQLMTQDVSSITPEFFAEQVLDELKRVAVRNAKARLNTLQILTPESFQILAEKVQDIQAGAIQGLANLRDIDVWARPHQEEILLPTGYPSLDRALGGGWSEELTIVFADSGMGKSMLLQNFAVHAAQKGKRVLEVTLELGLRPSILRHYRQITRMDRGTFRVESERARSYLQHWFRFAKGDLFLLEFPPYSLDPDSLKRTVERVGRLHGDVEFLVVDYLDLMVPARGKGGRGRYEDLGYLTHQLRSFCSTFEVPVVTASQAVRRPESSRRLTVRDMGDSYDKVRGAGNLLSLMQTEEEEETHQGRMGVLKVRESWGRGWEVPLYINRDLALIAELDHPNTQEIMRRLGHYPKSLPNSTPTPPTLPQAIEGNQSKGKHKGGFPL